MNIAETNGIVVADSPVKKDREFNRAEDKNVAAIVVYLNSTDNKLYYNYDGSEYSNEVPEDDFSNLFIKDAILNDGNSLKRAIAFSGTDGIIWGGSSAQNA